MQRKAFQLSSAKRPAQCKRHCEICGTAVTGRNKTAKQKKDVVCHRCTAKLNRIIYRVKQAFFF